MSRTVTETHDDACEGTLLCGCELRAAQNRDAVDAERYRWLRDRSNILSYDTMNSGRTPLARLAEAVANFPDLRECIRIELPLYHVKPDTEPYWTDTDNFDWSRNMDAAIDTALAREKATRPDEQQLKQEGV